MVEQAKVRVEEPAEHEADDNLADHKGQEEQRTDEPHPKGRSLE
jgi:hypothetical protein